MRPVSRGRVFAADCYAGIDMGWLEQPRRVVSPIELRYMRRAQSLVVPWYEARQRVRSLVGTDVRIKRVS